MHGRRIQSFDVWDSEDEGAEDRSSSIRAQGGRDVVAWIDADDDFTLSNSGFYDDDFGLKDVSQTSLDALEAPDDEAVGDPDEFVPPVPAERKGRRR